MRLSHISLAVVTALILLACKATSPGRPIAQGVLAATGETCDSVADTVLAVTQSVEGLEGRYRLILVKTDSVRKPNGVFGGFLSLWRTSPNDSSVDGRRPWRGDRSIYFGSTDIDVDGAELSTAFNWKPLSDPTRAEVDPIRPPILSSQRKGKIGRASCRERVQRTAVR